MIIIKTTTDSHKAMKLIANIFLTKACSMRKYDSSNEIKYVVDGRITESEK